MGSDDRPVTPLIFLSFGICATGGPLALAGFFLPQGVASRGSMGLVVVLGAMAFSLPVAIWYRYSRHIVSAGGLYAFVEAAAGRKVARLQGAVWIVSYFLYLPYTVDYVVYYLLPWVFPGIGPWRPALEILIPLAIAALSLLPLRSALIPLVVLAGVQLAVLIAFAVVASIHTGVPVAALSAGGPVGRFTSSVFAASLLFVCVSLPLYLGGETEGGSRTVRKGLVAAFAVSAVAGLAGSLTWAGAPQRFIRADFPGLALARAAGGTVFGDMVGVTLAMSVLGVVMAEYFALGRLVHAISGRPVATTNLVVAAGFVVTSALSLINPDAFYDDLLKPSLIALWVSQLIAVALYPRLEAKKGGRLAPALLLTLPATALFGYGLWTGIKAVAG